MYSEKVKTFRSNGKLLITGEYAVLDGALSLALPTKKGQLLSVLPHENGFLWESFDCNNEIWFRSETDFWAKTDNPIAQTLQKILKTALELNPSFSDSLKDVKVQTHLDFDRNWGLGSSSTLINNIAQWAGVNPFELLFRSFGGSGYDIACAKNDTPVLYRLENQKVKVYPLSFDFPYKEKICFVYLGKKQNSKEGISLYKKVQKSKKKLVTEITEITENIIRTRSLSTFCELIDLHEQLISDFLKLPKVKDLYFTDFQGSIKSLGAWGGDFVLAISEKEDVEKYFTKKGFSVVIPYNEMIF